MDKQIDWQLRASMALNSAIASRHLISYAELADTAHIPSPHRIHKLTMWLETLVDSDHQSAKTTARRMGGIAPARTNSGARLFHEM